jgi:hypothetical protein
MLVAIVIPFDVPACATISASRACCLAFSTRQAFLREVLRQELQPDRRRAHEHRLAPFVTVLHIGDDRLDLLVERGTPGRSRPLDHRHVRRMTTVSGGRSAGTERPVSAVPVIQRACVHPEVVLNVIDASVWFSRWIETPSSLDRLMQAVGPAAAGHQPAGELVDDHHLAVLHDVCWSREQRARAAAYRWCMSPMLCAS